MRTFSDYLVLALPSFYVRIVEHLHFSLNDSSANPCLAESGTSAADTKAGRYCLFGGKRDIGNDTKAGRYCLKILTFTCLLLLSHSLLSIVDEIKASRCCLLALLRTNASAVCKKQRH